MGRERKEKKGKDRDRREGQTDRQRTENWTTEDDNCCVCARMNIQVNFELMFKLFSFQRQRLIRPRADSIGANDL